MRPRPPSHSTSRRCSASPCWRRSCIRSRTSWSTSRTSGSIPGRSVVNAAAVSARGLRLAARAPILANPLNLLALALIAVFALCALLAPVIAPYDPLAQELSQRLRPPSPEHWLGTDSLGRDIASRILYGARISLIIGVVVVASAGVVGTAIGLIAGYAGGLVDEALMRLTEVFLAFPALILAMAIAGITSARNRGSRSSQGLRSCWQWVRSIFSVTAFATRSIRGSAERSGRDRPARVGLARSEC